MSSSWTATDVHGAHERAADLRHVLHTVTDPEIPVLTIEDLGILRGIEVRGDGHVIVTITPTYSGCPAMQVITDEILIALAASGYGDASVKTVLTPAWTTDWMTEAGRRKLTEYGIAPPSGRMPPGAVQPVPVGLSVRCPQCGSPDTREISRFGSTACKSLWSCKTCLEPFDHFKAI